MSSDAKKPALRMLVHACCGPCSLEPTRIFAQEGIDTAIYYSNPNIHPQGEYEHRLETLEEHVTKPQGLELIKDAYDPDTWEREVGVYGTDRENRCRACYRMRLERTARMACERGFDAISTTLTISPYQFTDVILQELEEAASRHGLQALGRDFRDCYPQTTSRSHELGMYRQNYCGCRFSIAEAAAERATAKERREQEKHLRHTAMILTAAEGLYTQRNQL